MHQQIDVLHFVADVLNYKQDQFEDCCIFMLGILNKLLMSPASPVFKTVESVRLPFEFKIC